MRRHLAPLVVVSLALTAGCTDDSGLGTSDDYTTEVTSQIFTVDGWMSLEDEYIPRVCTQENGKAAIEALKAQAIAARTYVLRAMRDDPSLGTEKKPIVNGETFQAYAASASSSCKKATFETRGLVGQWGSELVIANYVAGALVKSDGATGKDPTKTEFFVTYNEGKSGKEITPAPHPIASPDRSDNRGCMGQNRSDYLAHQGYDYEKILRYFYGDDLDIAHVATGGQSDKTPEACNGDSVQRCEEGSSVLSWCQGGQRQEYDCADKGMSCGHDAASGDQCVPAAADCGTLDYDGHCEGDTVVYCDGGKTVTEDCAAKQLTCGWASSSVGYDCMPKVEGDCASGTVEPQCVESYFIRCRKDELIALNCGQLGMACGFFDDRWDCFQVAQ